MSLALALLVVTAAPSPDWKTLHLALSLSRALETGDYGGTPGGFKAITLSHVADGCVWQAQRHPERTDAARHCVALAHARALDLHAEACPVSEGARRCDVDALLEKENPLSLAHWLLVMGANDALGTCPDAALHQKLAAGLAAQAVADEFAHVPSYRNLPLRWPADQSALLAGLHRADVAHGTTFHVEPLEKFTTFIDQKGLHRSGLPVSEVTGKGPGARFPRGCAQSFISRYLAEVDAPRTATWWKTYKRSYFVTFPLGVVGFREWPPGVDGASDTDSGPIVFGIGAAASALAISAAKAQGDGALARQLERSAEQVMSLGVGSAVAHQAFAEAIRFEGQWHPLAVTDAR
ncbi:MAG: hypothetical protein Q8L14_24530 [Myxococcales bacterium]|nr:hypothetical protein [Myxococcales bacterium]